MLLLTDLSVPRPVGRMDEQLQLLSFHRKAAWGQARKSGFGQLI
jgi:hypothetical protein